MLFDVHVSSVLWTMFGKVQIFFFYTHSITPTGPCACATRAAAVHNSVAAHGDDVALNLGLACLPRYVAERCTYKLVNIYRLHILCVFFLV